MEPGPRVPVGVRVRGGAAGLADQCLFTVMDRTCVGVWAGAAHGGSFKTVDRLSVCDWVCACGSHIDHGNATNNTCSQGRQDLRAYTDGR